MGTVSKEIAEKVIAGAYPMAKMPITLCKCKAWASSMGHKCTRNGIYDGYCRVHSPKYRKLKEYELFIAAAGTVKNKLDEMGYDGQKCVELLPDMLDIISFLEGCNPDGLLPYDMFNEAINIIKQAKGE